jgi:hypothetical protein
VLPLLAVAALSGWIALGISELGDYDSDAGPAIAALSHGHISAFLAEHPDMGPVSTLLRAPFAALGGSELAVYRLGSFACLLAVGLLGLYLARLAGRRGAGLATQTLLVALCLLNPLTFAALDAGHPEELLTGALAVAAVAVAAQGNRYRAALLLGLAIASKQWAVIAALPVLMALPATLPAARLRAAALAAAIAVALTLPGAIANPDDFFETQRSLAVETQYVTPWSAWYPSSSATAFHLAEARTTIHPHYASDFVARASHPLIVLSALLLPAALAIRRRRLGISGADAMALLALLALLRCLLDPVDNLYYHAPLLLALVGWDALAANGLPLRSLTAAALLEMLSRWDSGAIDPAAFNAVYLAIAGAAAIAIAATLLRRAGAETRAELGPPRARRALAAPPLAGS